MIEVASCFRVAEKLKPTDETERKVWRNAGKLKKKRRKKQRERKDELKNAEKIEKK